MEEWDRRFRELLASVRTDNGSSPQEISIANSVNLLHQRILYIEERLNRIENILNLKAL